MRGLALDDQLGHRFLGEANYSLANSPSIVVGKRMPTTKTEKTKLAAFKSASFDT